MRRLAILLGPILCALLAAGCATTEGSDGVAQSKIPGGRAQPRIACQPGFYFCPGEVAGCCPNGWGCASTHCVRPQAKMPGNGPGRVTCQPGFYFCPGEIPGCCPNGWGCASTYCIRPKGVNL